jgi:hypothetical protein
VATHAGVVNCTDPVKTSDGGVARPPGSVSATTGSDIFLLTRTDVQYRHVDGWIWLWLSPRTQTQN